MLQLVAITFLSFFHAYVIIQQVENGVLKDESFELSLFSPLRSAAASSSGSSKNHYGSGAGAEAISNPAGDDKKYPKKYNELHHQGQEEMVGEEEATLLVSPLDLLEKQATN